MKIFDSVHTEQFRLHTSDLDPGNRARLPYFFQLMQEAAGNHSHIYSLTIPDLLKTGRTWLISRQRLKIYAYPQWPETLTVETWVLPPAKLVSPRAFITRDSAGNKIFEGLSYWCVLDLSRKRPVPVSTVGDFAGLEYDQFTMERTIGKPAPPPEHPDTTHRFRPQIQYRDTDINGHVNNNTYTEWALESLPVRMRRESSPTFFEIHYQQETYMDDEIEVVTTVEEKTGFCRHTITALRENRKVPVCSASSYWSGLKSLT